MKKFIILITLITISHLGFTQMTTIYEGGINTPDSLYKDFGWWMGGAGSTGGCVCLYISSDGNNGVTSLHGQFQFSTLYLYKSIPDIANYGYLEFYIEYTLPDPNSELSIFTSDSLNFKTTPNSCGNLVETSPLQRTAIPYYNTHQDSNLIVQIHNSPSDSTIMNVSYIRVDVDLSSYMMFATDIKEQTAIDEFSLFASNKNINISTSSNNPYQVNVFNINGQEIYQGSKNGNSTIPLETNSNGIYLVRIVDSQGKVISKKVYLN